MLAHWADFSDRPSGTVNAPTEEDALERAKAFGNPTRARRLPYPAEPVLGARSDMPSFCVRPNECAGQSSCPRRRACSE